MTWIHIVLSVAIAVLATALFWTVKGNLRLQKELSIRRMADQHTQCEMNRLKDELREAQKQVAFRDGLNIGRRTDGLYRQILKRYMNGERFTIMMNGEKEGDENT